jgi:hypothetical protein
MINRAVFENELFSHCQSMTVAFAGRTHALGTLVLCAMKPALAGCSPYVINPRYGFVRLMIPPSAGARSNTPRTATNPAILSSRTTKSTDHDCSEVKSYEVGKCSRMA